MASHRGRASGGRGELPGGVERLAGVVGGAERVVERRDGGLLAVGGRDRRQGGAVVIGQLLCAGEERRREALIWRVLCVLCDATSSLE